MERERGDRRCQHRHCGRGPAGPSGGLIIGLGFYTWAAHLQRESWIKKKKTEIEKGNKQFIASCSVVKVRMTVKVESRLDQLIPWCLRNLFPRTYIQLFYTSCSSLVVTWKDITWHFIIGVEGMSCSVMEEEVSAAILCKNNNII